MNANENLAGLTRKNVETVARIEAASQAQRTRGERLSDAIAKIIGSWTFLLTQSAILGLWMILNLTAWIRHWDPYPFILLNLALSFQAAFAGPIIMMSQNRQSRFHERRNQLDLQINLLAEQENTEILRLLSALCEKAGIQHKDLKKVEILEEETNSAALMEQITASGGGEACFTPPPEENKK